MLGRTHSGKGDLSGSHHRDAHTATHQGDGRKEGREGGGTHRPQDGPCCVGSPQVDPEDEGEAGSGTGQSRIAKDSRVVGPWWGAWLHWSWGRRTGWVMMG